MGKRNGKSDFAKARDRVIAQGRAFPIIGEGPRPNILIAMGMYKFPRPKTIHRTLELVSDFTARRPDYTVRFQTNASSGLLSMRTTFAKMVLNDSSSSHVLFIDDDMDFPVGDTPDGPFNPLERLLALDKDVVGALCFGRDMHCKPMIAKETEDGWPHFDFDPNQLMQAKPFQVDFIGFGMVLIKREVFEGVLKLCGGNPRGIFRHHQPWAHSEDRRRRLENACRQIDWQPEASDRSLDYLVREIDAMQADCDSLGEDYSFCRLARQAGFEVWCDPAFDVLHIGDYGYGRSDWWHLHGHKMVENKKHDADSAGGRAVRADA